jgi:hypothetical protein
MPNTVIRRDLQTPTVTEEIRHYSSQYSAHLSTHPDGLVVDLMEQPDNKTPAEWSAYQIPSVSTAIPQFVPLFIFCCDNTQQSTTFRNQTPECSPFYYY